MTAPGEMGVTTVPHGFYVFITLIKWKLNEQLNYCAALVLLPGVVARVGDCSSLMWRMYAQAFRSQALRSQAQMLPSILKIQHIK